MIKLVLSDLDNTLVPLGHERVSDRTLKAIHAALDVGIRFGPATGRSRAEAAQFLAHDERCHATGVYANGHQVFCDGSLVFERRLVTVELARAADIACSHGRCALIVYRDDGRAEWVGDEPERLGRLLDLGMLLGGERRCALTDLEVLKAGLLVNVPADEQWAIADEILAACPSLGLTHTTDHWFDVVGRGASKALGVTCLMESLGLDPTEVCAFGDAENDLEMFATVAHSCAVANAMPKVRAEARWQLADASRDGVALALEQLAEAARAGSTPAFMA